MSEHELKPTPKKLLTARQLSEELGQHYKTILKWAREGQIPIAARVGQNYLRFDLDKVNQRIEENGRS